ncbi:MAG: pseudaminic acid cytidylyltransferase, partial [Helicobacter sp.]|nr:pseudaminic acid cytidylyltransferase [Helicobacter sp.]
MIESICIIPARGGSKRIPKKNIKNFLGKPIITYSIQTAQKSRIFDEIYVSSDSQEILQIAKNEGVKTIKRPENLSQDYTSTQEVILHAIHLLNLHQSWVCCLYATAPLLDAKTLQEAFKKRDKTCYLFSAVEYSYSPYR